MATTPPSVNPLLLQFTRWYSDANCVTTFVSVDMYGTSEILLWSNQPRLPILSRNSPLNFDITSLVDEVAYISTPFCSGVVKYS